MGAGTVRSAVEIENAATMSPGLLDDTAGLISVDGDYRQTATGTLDMEIGGFTPGAEFDRVEISGLATFDGAFDVQVLDGFSVNGGDSFQVATFTSREGDFATKNGLDVGDGVFFTTVFGAGDLTLTTGEIGFEITPTSGLTTTEIGGSDTFSIVLRSQPTADVTLGLSSNDPTEGAPDVSSVTFTQDDWDIPQVVTVIGANDSVDDGDVDYVIVTEAATSADPDWNGITATNVNVTNADDDTRGVVVTPTTGLVTRRPEGPRRLTCPWPPSRLLMWSSL